MRRKELLVSGEVYHIFSRSIADYRIFNDNSEFERMLQLIKYYQVSNDIRYSFFIGLEWVQKTGFNNALDIFSKNKDKQVQIIAYCLLPTHFHLILKQLTNNGISNYMRKVLDGYTKYFNTTHKRKGPLWESKFQNVLVKTDEQLLHLTRYVHLNPITARLVDKPEDWSYSSFNEYLSQEFYPVCQFTELLDIKSSQYRKFVNNRIAYQRELTRIKNLILE